MSREPPVVGPRALPSLHMTFQRSYENAEAGQQLYAVLEAYKKPEVLWAKLATGNYDWLGVRRNGRYVVGRPRLTPSPRTTQPASRTRTTTGTASSSAARCPTYPAGRRTAPR